MSPSTVEEHASTGSECRPAAHRAAAHRTAPRRPRSARRHGALLFNAAPSQVRCCSRGATCRGFDQPANRVNVQLRLAADGSVDIEVWIDRRPRPARSSAFLPKNWGFRCADVSGVAASGPVGAGSRCGRRALLEPEGVLHFVGAVGKEVVRDADPDDYDQIVPLDQHADERSSDMFAFESTVANEIRGIGIDIYECSAAHSAAAAGCVASSTMDWLGRLPGRSAPSAASARQYPQRDGPGSGHRWLAFRTIRDRKGARSDRLLGRDEAHWSFFFDSDASVMEGTTSRI